MFFVFLYDKSSYSPHHHHHHHYHFRFVFCFNRKKGAIACGYIIPFISCLLVYDLCSVLCMLVMYARNIVLWMIMMITSHHFVQFSLLDKNIMMIWNEAKNRKRCDLDDDVVGWLSFVFLSFLCVYKVHFILLIAILLLTTKRVSWPDKWMEEERFSLKEKFFSFVSFFSKQIFSHFHM